MQLVLGLLAVLLASSWPLEEPRVEKFAPAKPALSVPSNEQLRVSREGERQVFDLPSSWIQRYWQKEAPVHAYLALLPPHPDDAKESAPCAPPPRIIMGYRLADGSVHENLVLCVEFCDAQAQGGLFKRLWGRLTRLEKVEARLRKDGFIDLTLRFRKLGFDQKTGDSVNERGEPIYQGRARTRHFRVEGPRSALPEGGALSCISPTH